MGHIDITIILALYFIIFCMDLKYVQETEIRFATEHFHDKNVKELLSG